MNINEILLEETYNLSFGNNVFNALFKKAKDYNKKTNLRINITHLLPQEYNKKNYKIYIIYKVNPKTVQIAAEEITKENDEGDDILIGFKIIFTSPTPLKDYSEKELFDTKEVLKHELVHILDLIRSDNNLGDIDMKKSQENPVSYLKDASELNALINLVKQYKNKKEYNSIKHYDDLLQFLLTAGQSAHLTATKELINDKSLKEKIIKRLSREGILPKNFI
jgi:hypothetical protein